jgi:hypothetical protein
VNEGTAAAREHLLDAPTVEQQHPQAFLRPAHVVDGDTARHDAGIALFSATTVAGASRLATFPRTQRQTKCSPSWPLRASAQERNANAGPTLTTPPFEPSSHRHAAASPDATHLRRKTTSEGLQAADMVREGPNV